MSNLKNNKNTPFICPKCKFEIKTSRNKHVNSCDGKGPRRRRKKEKYIAWNKNKNNIDLFGIEKSSNISDKISNKLKLAFKEGRIDGRGSTPEIEKERRRKISETMKKNKCGGYRKGSGRGKKGKYKGIWCDSSWELAWVIYHIDHNISFERNTEKFEYVFNNDKHYYLPDFKIGEEFIEIKGYVTKQWEEKKKQFPQLLKTYYKKDMKLIIEYVILKYGKDFIKLYE